MGENRKQEQEFRREGGNGGLNQGDGSGNGEMPDVGDFKEVESTDANN